MQILGKVHLIGQTESVGANGFTKRQIVIETSEQYPQKVAIDFVKDKCSVLDNYKVGQEVTVDVNVKGNEYNGKFYVNLQGWKISANGTAQPQQNAPINTAPFETVTNVNQEEHDDLPF